MRVTSQTFFASLTAAAVLLFSASCSRTANKPVATNSGAAQAFMKGPGAEYNQAYNSVGMEDLRTAVYTKIREASRQNCGKTFDEYVLKNLLYFPRLDFERLGRVSPEKWKSDFDSGDLENAADFLMRVKDKEPAFCVVASAMTGGRKVIHLSAGVDLITIDTKVPDLIDAYRPTEEIKMPRSVENKR